MELKTGIRSYILGQGDNQLSRLLISKQGNTQSADAFIQSNQDYISGVIDSFISMLDKCALEIGLVIKPDESWVSSSFLVYGKDMMFKGAYLPQSAKRISRTMVDVNEIHPTLTAKIATLQTTGLATTQKGYSLLEPYILCNIETLLILKRDSSYSILLGKRMNSKIIKSLSDEDIFFKFLHLTSDVGALPILPWISYLYRGHPDDLTTFTSMICIGSENNCTFCQKMIEFLYDQKYTKALEIQN